MKTETESSARCDARAFIDAFASGDLPPGSFHHREHVQLAWSYLQCHTLPETLELLPAALRRFAAAHGATGLYHETITWAYILVVQERIHRSPAPEADFEHFAADNPDLFEWPSPILEASYRDETLWSDRARSSFVWPDAQEAEEADKTPPRRTRDTLTAAS